MTKALPQKKPKQVKKKKPESVADILKRKQASGAMVNKPEPNIVSNNTLIDLNKINNRLQSKSDLARLKNPQVYIAFIDFLVSPEINPKIKTQGDFAKHFKVSEQCLCEWKNRAGFWEEVREHRREIFKSTILPMATLALKRKLQGDAGAPEIKLAFQLADEFEEKSIVENRKPSKMSDERKRDLGARLNSWKNVNIKTD